MQPWFNTEKLISEIHLLLPENYTIYSSAPYQLTLEIHQNQKETKILSLPIPDLWSIEKHEKGFGGWLISSGRTTRFIRVLASPSVEMDSYIRNLQTEGFDLREDFVREQIFEFIGNRIRLLSLEAQLAKVIVDSINSLGGTVDSNSLESLLKQQALFKKSINTWLLKFPPLLVIGQQLPFYQNQICIDYKRFPGGAAEAVRDSLVEKLYETEIKDLYSDRTYRVDPTATSKNTPGSYLYVVSTDLARRSAEGAVIRYLDLETPVLLAAAQPILGNRKRSPREFGGLKQCLPLLNPRDFKEGIWNGFEEYITPEIAHCLTRVCTAFVSAESVNVYGSHNLDDILLTNAGKEALTTVRNEKTVISPEDWERKKALYLTKEGKPRQGYKIEESLVPASSLKGIPLYTKEYVITNEDSPESWVVGKVLLDSTLKAMVKTITHRIIGIDRAGKEYEIECIVSPESIIEKKVETIVLSSVLSRINFGYIEHHQYPINSNRLTGDPSDKYDDLVANCADRLQELGESTDGKIAIYSIGDAGEYIYLGEAVVGYLRASRLPENERSSTKVRTNGIIPVQTPMRHLTDRPAVLDSETEETLNLVTDTWRALI